jgi:phage I-like protein
MNGANATGRAIHAVALNVEAGAPAEIMLLPAGQIAGVDGRTFLNDAPDEVVAAFAAAGFDVPIDIEHATELKGPNGEPAPAHGWIKQLINRAGAIHGRVEWTGDGEKLVASKAYRYVSPAFLHERDGARRVIKLTSVGLTNRPNLQLPALNTTQENPMDRAAICTALNIVAAATDPDIMAAINRLKVAAETPDPEKFVPRADLDAALNRATTAEQTLAARDKTEHEARIVAAVDAAVKDGKIAPASKEHYLACAAPRAGWTSSRRWSRRCPSSPARAGSTIGRRPTTRSTPKTRTRSPRRPTATARSRRSSASPSASPTPSPR